MKQKLVINVTMKGPKCRSKALKIVVGFSGVESAGLGGKDKNQIEVIGDGVDAAELTILLKRKMGYAELVSVAAVEGDKKDGPTVQPVVWPMYGGTTPYTYIYTDYPSIRYQDPSCSIM